MKEFFKTIIIAVALSLIIVQFIQPTLVSGNSMFPNYKDSDYLIVNKTKNKVKDYKYGDIIIFDLKGKKLIKRVIGLPGDVIKIKDYDVYRNGKLLKEPYLHEVLTDGEKEVYKVPDDCIFAMGDNREISLDCRFSEVGYVKENQIVGKPFVRLYPFDKIGECK